MLERDLSLPAQASPEMWDQHKTSRLLSKYVPDITFFSCRRLSCHLSPDSEDLFVLLHASRYISEAARLKVAISPSGSNLLTGNDSKTTVQTLRSGVE